MNMWHPPLNFITLHYVWIIFAGLLSFVILYPFGNLEAIDAYFFGASASTESGLNTVDVNILPTYQQVYIYIIPIVTNLGFLNIVVVIVRLYWFKKKLGVASSVRGRNCCTQSSSIDIEPQISPQPSLDCDNGSEPGCCPGSDETLNGSASRTQISESKGVSSSSHGGRISFAPDVNKPKNESILYIPSPRERDQGKPFIEKEVHASIDTEDDDDFKENKLVTGQAGLSRRRPYTVDDAKRTARSSAQMVAESLFVLGAVPSRSQETVISRRLSESRFAHLPGLSRQVTIGRNSRFRNMTPLDREQLGGIEYRSLKLLLKIIIGYYFGLHLLGAIALVPWIHKAPAKYTDFLAELGIGKTWWALYSSQSMINNLGFTLTPNSMISFRDATWPMLIMTFLAYAGNTCYPVLLRLVIWVMSKLVPKASRTRESLQFLLDHPRRCYTLLFPSKPTWILFGILFALNFIDVVLIIILDLYNPEVNSLSAGPRVLAALFQAASARHTGAATFNLANVNPAVQFSLLVMMYIAVLPIAVSIRASNTYEEKALGIYESESELDETDGKSYFISHVRNQLSFDLWYIFLGTFIICIAESVRIVDNNEPAFAVFTVFFEVVSAYGNVGLSLGHPSVNTSLSGQFKVISKLVICAMMIRGRHRGLPYSLDKAIMLPGEGDEDQEDHNEMPMAT